MSNTSEPTTKKITIIPATKSLHPERDGVTPTRDKKRVAAYCRVSTSQEEQQGSYNLQQSYYEHLINSRPDWELAGIYGDEGKSGTSLSGRTGFIQMMDDVRAGKIDYIIAKATSRFGRNNSEFITILDELDSYGVEVLFESEGILTSGQKDRTMLQIMGVANEHYSSTLSNNVRWSKERNMRDGKVTFCYKTFLGYKKGADGNPEIVEEEARIVREIYEMFLSGKSYTYIARNLTERCIPTPSGKTTWGCGTIKSILTNEKYTGDAILQKTFTRSYLDKHVYKNNGERPQVVVEDNHPGIIDKATFERTQELVEKRKTHKDPGTGKTPFTGRIICKECGSIFGHKTWSSRGGIKYSIWACNHKYSEETTYGGHKCKVANLRQEWIEQGYLYALGQILADRGEYLGKYRRKLVRVNKRLNSGDIDRELKELENISKTTEENLAKLRNEWEFTYGDHTEFDKRQDALTREAAEAISRIDELEKERGQLRADKKMLTTVIQTIEALPDKLSPHFNGKIFINLIDYVEVSQYVLAYHFFGDECVKVNISLTQKISY
ncbi:recombinase family protein [Candidatus Saccharibacteria bacterium]|nr:recombinase family protein [Candidatus Saccharibacteria bacterium]